MPKRLCIDQKMEFLPIMKKLITLSVVLTTILWSMGLGAFVPTASAATIAAGDLIKASGAAVYYYAADGKRYTFPTESTFLTWYKGWSSVSVKTITDNELSAIDLGGNVVVRPGTKLIKIATVPKVFAVMPKGKLAWVNSEATAKAIFGDNWNKNIVVIPDGFWTNYTDSGVALSGTVYPEGALVKYGTDIYYVNADGTKSKIASESVMTANNWDMSYVLTGSSSISMTTGTEITAAVGTVIDVSQGGGAGTGAVVTGGNLSVALASDNPVAAYVVSDATTDGSAYMTPVMKVTLTSSVATEVDSISFTRGGISANTDFANLYLFDGDTLVTDAYSLSNNTFIFNKNFIVNGSKTLTLKADLIAGTSGSKNFNFSLAGTDAVKLVSGSVSGSFPISSNTMITSSITDLAKVTVVSVNGTPGSSVDAGATDQTLFKFTVSGNDQKVEISKITLTAIGTIESNVFSNLYLWDGTKKVGETVASLDSSKKVTFNLTTPYTIDRESKTFQLKGNVDRGTSRTFYFEVENAYDMTIRDTNYNVMVKPIEANESPVTPDTWTIVYNTTTSTITTGSLVISYDTVNSPNGNIARGATAKTIGIWKLKAVGEDVKVTSLTVNSTVTAGWSTDDVDNGRVYFDGSQVGTTKDLDTNGVTATGTEFTFGSSLVVPAGVEKELKVIADIRHGDGTAITDGHTLKADLAAGSSNAMRMSTGTTFSTAASTGNTLTVTAPTLTAVNNSSLAAQTVIASAQKAKVASFLFTAGAAEAVTLTTVSITNYDKDGSTTTYGIGNAFQNLVLYNGATQLGSTISSPSTTSGADNSFSFTGVNIGASQSVQLDVYADVKSSIADGTNWDNADSFKVASASGTSADTNASVDATVTTALGQALTAASSGTLTIANASTPTMPISTYLVSGKTEQTVATWKYSASNTEDINVYRVVVYETGTDGLPGNAQNLKLFVDGNQVGSTIPALIDSTDNTAVFESTTPLFTVTKNSYKYLTLKTDITGSDNATFSVDSSDLKFAVKNVATITASTDVSAKGVLSGTYVAGAAGATYTANNMKVTKTKPTFTKVNPTSTTLTPGTMEVLRFKIAADAGADVTFDGTNHNIRFTIGQNGAEATARAANIYDAETGLTIATALSYALNTSSGVLNFTDVGTVDGSVTGWSVPAGSEKTVYVKVDLTDFATAGESFSLTLNNAAASVSDCDVSWSDNGIASADIANASFAGLGLPLEGSTFVKP